MPYVERRDGQIVGAYEQPQPGYAEEWVDHVPPDMTRVRAEATIAIVHAVGVARGRYAQDAPLQAAIYDVKAQEADAFVAMGRPGDATAFPLLVASAAANGRDVSTQADLIRAKRDVWLQIAARTEALREQAVNAIRNCETPEQAAYARDYYVEQLAKI